MNLYDKYKYSGWDQLWSDDSMAVVLRSDGDKQYTVIVDDGRDCKQHKIDGLSDALDYWNTCISKHLRIGNEV